MKTQSQEDANRAKPKWTDEDYYLAIEDPNLRSTVREFVDWARESSLVVSTGAGRRPSLNLKVSHRGKTRGLLILGDPNVWIRFSKWRSVEAAHPLLHDLWDRLGQTPLLPEETRSEANSKAASPKGRLGGYYPPLNIEILKEQAARQWLQRSLGRFLESLDAIPE